MRNGWFVSLLVCSESKFVRLRSPRESLVEKQLDSSKALELFLELNYNGIKPCCESKLVLMCSFRDTWRVLFQSGKPYCNCFLDSSIQDLDCLY